MKRIQVSVSQENIDNGVPADCTACPITLALKDLGIEASVYSSAVYFPTATGMQALSVLPTLAQCFIQDFDRAQRNRNEWTDPIEPFTFNLQVPE